MKGASIAILVVLSVALSSVLAAEKNDVKYDKKVVRGQIVANLRKVTNKCSELADKYINNGDAETDQLKTAKLSVAAQLMESIGTIRYVDMLFACEELKGEHYQTELEFLSLEVYKIDTKVDANIQALVKLGEELPETTILKDVAEIVRGIRDNRYFLHELSIKEVAAISQAA